MMPCRVEVLFTPAEIRHLPERNLAETTCVVFDVLRATSAFVTALAHGAAAVIPLETIGEALATKRKFPDALLAGERNGLRIDARVSGGVTFDFGNSPREFLTDRIRGRTIISTTTNGTRALQACRGAALVLASSWLNLTATRQFILHQQPESLLLVCSGTGEEFSLEDSLAVGNLCDRLAPAGEPFQFADSALAALHLYRNAAKDLASAVKSAANARRLLAIADLREDVDFCLEADRFDIVARMDALGALHAKQLSA